MTGILKKIFIFIISFFLWIYWWIIAVFTLTVIVLISFILPKKTYNAIVKASCSLLVYCLFLFPVLHGVKRNDLPFPVIFAGNHVSFFDLFICGSILPGYPRGMELESHFRTPFYGWFLSKFGQIPVNPGSFKSLRESMNKMAERLLKKERNFLIMPEGHRTDDGSIKAFKSGAFNLSKKTGAPIVPVLFKNLYKHANKKKIIIPGIINVYILEPVYPDKFNSEDEMAEYVRNIMINELNK